MISGSSDKDASDRLLPTDLCSLGRCYAKQPCETGDLLPAARSLAPEEGRYSCGSCARVFPTICCLHQHLQASHESPGSYHYNHYLRTAFPKFDTCCQFTQTCDSVINKDLLESPSVEQNAGLYSISTSDGTTISKYNDKQGNTSQDLYILKQIETTTACKTENIIAEVSLEKDQSKVEDVDSIQGYSGTADGADDDYCNETEKTSSFDAKSSKNPDNESASENGGSRNKQIKVENKSRKRKQQNPKNVRIETATAKTNNNKCQPKRRKVMDKSTRDENISSTCNLRKDQVKDINCRCELCGAKFSFTRGLLRHEQIKHFNEMKHICQFCDQRFMREYNLQKHIKCVHTVGRGKKNKEKKQAIKKPDKDEPIETSEIPEATENLPPNFTNIHSAVNTGSVDKNSEAERNNRGRTFGKKSNKNKSKRASNKGSLDNKEETVESASELVEARHVIEEAKSSLASSSSCLASSKGLSTPQVFSLSTGLASSIKLSQQQASSSMGLASPLASSSTGLVSSKGLAPSKDLASSPATSSKGIASSSKVASNMGLASSMGLVAPLEPGEGKTSTKVGENVSPRLPHTCQICGCTMPRAKMEVHQRLHSGERPFICHVCGKGLISQTKLQRHMLIHSHVKKHTCDVCGAGFQMKYKLRMHQHIHTGKKPYLCSICGAEFNHSSNLATHTRCVHLQIKPFVCTTCGGRYAKKSQLDGHMLSHSTKKHFTCRYCGKSFKYYKGMKRHEKNHQEENKFSCTQCGAWFGRQDNLERHVATSHDNNHTDMCLTCSMCSKTFKSERSLVQHERWHSKPQLYQCVLCGETYKVMNQYFTHMLAAHGVETEQARAMVAGEKGGQRAAMSGLGQVPAAQVDPNMPLRLDVEPPAGKEKPMPDLSDMARIQTTTYSVSGGLIASHVTSGGLNASHVTSGGLNASHVTQVVSGIMDDNRAAITALTRAATENLRLHSEDVNDEEKLKVIVPPLNPMILLEQNQAFGSIPGTSGLIVSQGTNHSSANVVMLAPVSQANLKQNPHTANETISISQQQTITLQNPSLSQEVQPANLGPLQIALTQESGNLTPGLSIQEARMTLETLARQHETVSVPLTLMRLSENMMDPPVDRQNHDTQQQTHATGSVAYRIQNMF